MHHAGDDGFNPDRGLSRGVMSFKWVLTLSRACYITSPPSTDESGRFYIQFAGTPEDTQVVSRLRITFLSTFDSMFLISKSASFACVELPLVVPRILNMQPDYMFAVTCSST